MEATTKNDNQRSFPSKRNRPGWWFLTYVLFLHIFTSTNREIIQFDEQLRICLKPKRPISIMTGQPTPPNVPPLEISGLKKTLGFP